MLKRTGVTELSLAPENHMLSEWRFGWNRENRLQICCRLIWACLMQSCCWETGLHKLHHRKQLHTPRKAAKCSNNLRETADFSQASHTWQAGGKLSLKRHWSQLNLLLVETIFQDFSIEGHPGCYSKDRGDEPSYTFHSCFWCIFMNIKRRLLSFPG